MLLNAWKSVCAQLAYFFARLAGIKLTDEARIEELARRHFPRDAALEILRDERDIFARQAVMLQLELNRREAMPPSDVSSASGKTGFGTVTRFPRPGPPRVPPTRH